MKPVTAVLPLLLWFAAAPALAQAPARAQDRPLPVPQTSNTSTPFLGGVPFGTATSETITISILDAMLVVGIGALQVVLDKGQQEDWFSSSFITTLAIVSGVTLVALIFHELTTDDPIIDLRVFKARSYAVGVFLMTVVGFVLYGSMVLLPIMLQTVLGYPPLQAGIAMAPRGIGSFVMMPLVGLITGRFDPRKLLTTGLFVGGSTLLWLSRLNLQAGYWDIFWPQFCQGLGLSALFVPLTTISMVLSRAGAGHGRRDTSR